ncbi:glucan 1,4-alpha-glucosidase [Shewanella sp. JM162201]|uniref:Glucan 1,4-alpha-glucosidase n=1 Tax=Shewanella jiangmenensis TaxID=2837387 RepID=A0ABS5V7U8_9GAMM|nr:glycoside hydrolase family 15 protein [Shewanella jiangmenensis]MBT1446030.1 glucan 1,4-alpha-glucosidase [Shewanella jiangmenensis]
MSAVALALAAALSGVGCSDNTAATADTAQSSSTAQSPSAAESKAANAANVAPGAPGNTPTWAFAGKTGIGTSYEPYVDGKYQGSEANPMSRVWFSTANGVLTETMYGLIHNAQLRELSFIVKGTNFVDVETKDTIHSQRYLHTDQSGNPESLALVLDNRDKEGKYRIEKQIITDPHRDALVMRVTISAMADGLTAYLYADPQMDNGGADDIAYLDDTGFIAAQATPAAGGMQSAMSIQASVPFVARQVGFEGRSAGIEAILAGKPLEGYSQTFSGAAANAAGANGGNDNAASDNQGNSNIGNSNIGNVALTAELATLNKGESVSFDLVLGFAAASNVDDAAKAASQTAKASLGAGFDKLADDFAGNSASPGWRQYLKSLKSLNTMAGHTADGGKLLNISAMVLKAQEDKTHAGALIASLSNPWGDTIDAIKPSTGYKAVWPRDFYQCAMAFLAMGDADTAKVAFEYLKQIQAGPNLKGYEGVPGWFLQKTHVDGETEWVAVQLDQTAMPIMLGWKLWQAGVLSPDEAKSWYHSMLKPAAEFLVSGGEVSLDWNKRQITPPVTQQERWEEQEGYSPSTMAALITGLNAAAALARHASDIEAAERFEAAATRFGASLGKHTVTHTGSLAAHPYIVRLSPNGEPDTDAKLADNNGRPGLDQRLVLDAGFLELVRYGVVDANDAVVQSTLKLVDSENLDENLRLKYSFTTKAGASFPGFRRYGNDGYGEDTQSGANYYETGSNSANQRGRVWPFFTGERGHYELAALTHGGKALDDSARNQLIGTYVAGMESFANEGGMLPEQVWDGVGNPTRFSYQHGQGTNSATPLAWTHAEYVKLVRSVTDGKVWDGYPFKQTASLTQKQAAAK